MVTRRQFLPAAAAGSLTILSRAAVPRRNILFIAIDDLNDWIGCLGGHPQTRTPNLDRLARQGVLFTNAHCAAPLCNPSRAALLTGVRPSTSGVYTNRQPFRQSSITKEAVTLPMHLRAHGYRVIGSGKVFHGGFPDPPSWDDYWPSQQQNKPPDPQPPKLPANGIPGSGNMDWGPVDVADEEMGDMKVVEWVSRHLAKKVTEPLFLGCGIFRPHLQWYVPRKYFEMFPVNTIQLPPVKEDDLDDVPPIGASPSTTAITSASPRTGSGARRSRPTWPRSPSRMPLWGACCARWRPGPMPATSPLCCGAITGGTWARSSTGASSRCGKRPRAMC